MVLEFISNMRNQWFPPKPSLTEANVPQQYGKVFIVTGGNTGIGYELIKILYGTGAKIYMASRSKDKAEKAIRALMDTTPAPKTPGQVKFLQIDLNDLVSVKAAAATFALQETKLNVLWNNAGAGANVVQLGDRTEQDLDPMMGTHCVATLFFSNLLVPQLRAASSTESPARVVWTSSFLAEGNSPTNGIDLKILDNGAESLGLVKNYGMAKAGTWMLSREFARRYGKENILTVAQNPGNLRAGSYDGVPALTMFFISPVLHELKFGGYTELYAGLSPEISLENNGAYIIPWGRIRPDEACPRKDILNAMKSEEECGLGYPEKLWEWCEVKWKPYM